MTPCSFSHLIADKGPKTYIRKKKIQVVLGELDILIQKTETRSHLSPCTKINSKWIKEEALKLQEENRAETLQDVGAGNAFLNRTPIAQEIEQELTNGAAPN
jgi:hypothetical protein